MKSRLLIFAALFVAALACPSLADVDPQCANVDAYSSTIRGLTSEMQTYVQTNDINSARGVYEYGIHMALTAYNLVNTCGIRNAAEIDAGLEQLVETAYVDKVIPAREALGWIRAILATAYAHGDTEEQVERWTAVAKGISAGAGGSFPRTRH